MKNRLRNMVLGWSSMFQEKPDTMEGKQKFARQLSWPKPRLTRLIFLDSGKMSLSTVDMTL
jgi:hypothetical protein